MILAIIDAATDPRRAPSSASSIAGNEYGAGARE